MKLRKIISLILCVSMMGSICSVGAAAATAEQTETTAKAQTMIADSFGKNMKDKELLKTVSNDLTLLEQVTLSDNLTISQVDSDGDVTYQVTYEEIGVTDYINVMEDNEGNIILNITDGDKHDELTFTGDGKVILDGYEVTFEEEEIIESLTKEKTDALLMASPRAGMYPQMFGVNPVLDGRGKPVAPSGYKYTGGTYSGKNLSLGKQVAEITISALISIIAGAAASSLSKAIATLSSVSDATSCIKLALTLRQRQLALVADQCGGAKAVSVGVSEYAKNDNNSLHCEWYYSVSLYMMTYTTYAAAKRTLDAT